MANQQRVRTAYQYLTGLAIEGQVTTYTELAHVLDLPERGNYSLNVMTETLTHIYNWCAERNMPKLTVLVGKKSGPMAGIPGVGFWVLDGNRDITTAEKRLLAQQYQRDVFNYYKGLQTNPATSEQLLNIVDSVSFQFTGESTVHCDLMIDGQLVSHVSTDIPGDRHVQMADALDAALKSLARTLDDPMYGDDNRMIRIRKVLEEQQAS